MAKRNELPKDFPKLPPKFPKKITEGQPMSYSDVKFPKPQKKPRKSKWGVK